MKTLVITLLSAMLLASCSMHTYPSYADSNDLQKKEIIQKDVEDC